MFSRKSLVAAVFIVVGLVGLCGRAQAQCYVINVYDPDGYEKTKSISVGLFSLEGGRIIYKGGPLETPRRVLLESLKEDLEKTKYFSSVAVVAADQKPDSHYLLEGEILGVHGGNRFNRIMIGGLGNAGQMRVNGRLFGPAKKSDNGEEKRPLISDWECISYDMGGFFGVGSNETAAKKNSDKIAKSLSQQVFGRMDKRLDKLTSEVRKTEQKESSKDLITGETKPSDRKWREKPEWKADDYENEIESFVVKSDRKRSRGVDALWLTSASYRAHQKLIPLMKQTAILNSNDVERGMLTTIEPVTPFEGKDVYILAVTFNVSVMAAPFLWDAGKIREGSYLTRVAEPDSKLQPLEFLDDAIRSYIVFRERKVFKGLSDFWAFHPTLLVFPTKRPDGSPFLRSAEDVVELRTEVDGYQVKLKFDFKHFGIKSLDELKIGGGEKTAVR